MGHPSRAPLEEPSKSLTGQAENMPKLIQFNTEEAAWPRARDEHPRRRRQGDP